MSFNFYEDTAKVLLELSPEDAGKIVQAIMVQRMEGVEPEFDAMTMAVYTLIKGQVDRAEEIRESRSTSGKKGGIGAKQNEASVSKDKQTLASAKQNEASVSTETKADTETKAVSKRVAAEKSDFEKTVDDFLEMRRKIKKPATARAMNTIRNKLQGLAPDDEPMQIRILEQSIECCWQTVYPLKDDSRQDSGRSPPQVQRRGNYI